MTRHAPEMDLIATVHFSQPTNLKGQEAVLTKADSSFSWWQVNHSREIFLFDKLPDLVSAVVDYQKDARHERQETWQEKLKTVKGLYGRTFYKQLYNLR